jgi:hypothetical protein
MRERTAVKVARFVPGRGEKSNLFFLFNDRGSNFASIRKDADCVPRKCNHATGIVVSFNYAAKKMRAGPSDSLYR